MRESRSLGSVGAKAEWLSYPTIPLDEKDYHELGGRYLDDRDKHRITQRLLRRLHDLSVEVEVKAA